jgi:hypothetical protein
MMPTTKNTCTASAALVLLLLKTVCTGSNAQQPPQAENPSAAAGQDVVPAPIDVSSTPILVRENTTWTTSRVIAERIVVFPNVTLRIQGPSPTEKIDLRYWSAEYCTTPPSLNDTTYDRSVGFALHDDATLLLENVEISGDCRWDGGPNVFHYINAEEPEKAVVNFSHVDCHDVYACGSPGWSYIGCFVSSLIVTDTSI